MKLIAPLLILGLTSCTTAIKQGNIISVTSRGLGVRVVTASSSTATPEIDFGFFATTVVTMPTSTNGPVNVPRYMNSINTLTGANPFNVGITEHLGSGEVYLGAVDNNKRDVDKAIVASEWKFASVPTNSTPPAAVLPK